jgi:hypothetical protein
LWYSGGPKFFAWVLDLHVSRKSLPYPI